MLSFDIRHRHIDFYITYLRYICFTIDVFKILMVASKMADKYRRKILNQ